MVNKNGVNLKERSMVKRKFLKDCFIKSPFFIVIVFSFTMCMNRKQNDCYESRMIDSSFLHAPFVAMNVLYQNDVYRIVIEENSIDLLVKTILSGKKYRYELYPIFRNDTLEVDRIVFDELKENGYIVTAQSDIDSIYCGKVENLLTSFFNKNGVLIDSLPDMEETYLIYLLFQHKVYLSMDCETGLLYVIDY